MRNSHGLRALALALLLVAAPLAAQPASPGFDPRTGDSRVDAWLEDINRYAGTYRDPFVDELARFHKAPRELVADLRARPGWTPGDVYFACSLAAQAGRPCRYVADEYDRDRGAGWGALAQRLGVAPGSPGFQRLKRGFAPTYERWGRPIRLDDGTRKAEPVRPKATARPPPSAPGDGATDPGPEAGGAPARPSAASTRAGASPSPVASSALAAGAEPARKPPASSSGKDGQPRKRED